MFLSKTIHNDCGDLELSAIKEKGTGWVMVSLSTPIPNHGVREFFWDNPTWIFEELLPDLKKIQRMRNEKKQTKALFNLTDGNLYLGELDEVIKMLKKGIKMGFYENHVEGDN